MFLTFDSERDSGVEKQPKVTIKILDSSKDFFTAETSARQIVQDLAYSKEEEPSILSWMLAFQRIYDGQKERRQLVASLRAMNNFESHTRKSSKPTAPTTKMDLTFDYETSRDTRVEKQPKVTIKILKSTASKDDSSEEETETETSARQIVQDLAYSKEGERSILSWLLAYQQFCDGPEEQRRAIWRELLELEEEQPSSSRSSKKKKSMYESMWRT